MRVNGLLCRDRTEALQRVFEHELLHLLEMLIWARSSCSAARFRGLAWNYFGHTATKHDLITQDAIPVLVPPDGTDLAAYGDAAGA